MVLTHSGQKQPLRFSSKQWKIGRWQSLKTVAASSEGIYKTKINQSSRVLNPLFGYCKRLNQEPVVCSNVFRDLFVGTHCG